MDAMVQLALEEGYTNITDAEIARAAAVSTEAFHREFPNKEECLLAVVNEFAAEAHDAVRRATRNDTEWAEGVHKGVEALIGYCAAHPGLVKLSFIDLFDAGNDMVARVSGVLDGFIKVMTQRVPEPEQPVFAPARNGPYIDLNETASPLWFIWPPATTTRAFLTGLLDCRAEFGAHVLARHRQEIMRSGARWHAQIPVCRPQEI